MGMISIIVPLAPGEDQWRALLDQLVNLPGPLEVILVAPVGDAPGPVISGSAGKQLRVLEAEPGRGPQLNAGARAATGDHLWFLHADSRLMPGTAKGLQRVMAEGRRALFYFDLSFRDGNPWLMPLNSLGANLRSRWLKVPFGDQGFFIRRDLFVEIGDFPEDLSYGEDHVFVWRARQTAVSVCPVGAAILTSARKYERHGWLRTTLRHQYLWLRQAWPEWKRLARRSEG